MSLQLELWDSERHTPLIEPMLRSASEAHGLPQQTVEWFRWKFFQSPWGSAVLAIARHDDSIAGAVAFGSYRLAAGATATLHAGFTYEQFVHPSFQGKGLFAQLLDLAESEARRRQLDVLVSLPNLKAVPGMRRHGFVRQSRLRTGVRIAALSALNRVGGPILNREAVAARALNTSFHLDSLDQVRPVGQWRGSLLGRVHDIHFLRWRFEESPFRQNYALVKTATRGSIVGCIARGGSRGRIREVQVLDVFSSSPTTWQMFAAVLKEVRHQLQPDVISILTSNSGQLRHLARRSAFLPVPNRINLYAKALTPQARRILDEDCWALTGSDIHTW